MRSSAGATEKAPAPARLAGRVPPRLWLAALDLHLSDLQETPVLHRVK